VVEGDLGRAAADLTHEAKAQATQVMGQLPRPVTSSEVLEVKADGDEYVARIRYSGEEARATVESRWAELEGRPRIVALDLV
jgi:hypothetical protein